MHPSDLRCLRIPACLLRRHVTGWLVLLLAAAAVSTPVGAQVRVIGPGPDCDINTLLLGNAGWVQAALSTGQTDIRLVGGNYLESINHALIQSVVISGGYANCAAAHAGEPPVAPTRLLLPADSNQALISVSGGAGTRHTMVLRDLVLEPQMATSIASQQAGIRAVGNLELRVVRSTIREFASLIPGGAIKLEDGHLVLEDAVIRDNLALHGGGIDCLNGSIGISARTLLIDNRAGLLDGPAGEGDGGAIRLRNCFAEIEARLTFADLADQTGFIGNLAIGSGGALHAHGGTVVLLGGRGCLYPTRDCPNGPVYLAQNRAEVDGGAVLLDGSVARLDAFALFGNSAGQRGGGLRVLGDAQVEIGTVWAGLAPDQRGRCLVSALNEPSVMCNLVAYNEVDPGGGGGGIAISSGSLHIEGGFVGLNAASFGSQLLANETAELDLTQSLVEGDADFASVLVTGQARLSTLHSQFTDQGSGVVVAGTDSARLRINHSLIAQTGDGQALAAVSTLPEFSGNCNALHGSYQYAGPHAGIAHIQIAAADIPKRVVATMTFGHSALVDQCPITPDLGPRDMLGRPRVDVVSAPATPVDIGPFEWRSRLFADRFEADPGQD